MCKCIYCNSEDLTVSDIISCALTGTKLTRKFVCHEHNSFTNDNFEKAAIAHLEFFRSALGLTERKGTKIKYKADLIIDGISIPNISVSGRASIYDDKKRLFPAEQNGSKVLIGNIDKLKQKKGVKDEEIETLDMSTTTISVKFSLQQLLASDEMLRTVAKIAYEWHCYIHNINSFVSENYQEIVDCILMKKDVSNFVEICVAYDLDVAMSQMCYLGSNGLFEYTGTDGYRYVIFDFWGIILYKIRIYDTHASNLNKHNKLELFLYDVDGGKRKIIFESIGLLQIESKIPEKAIQANHDAYIKKLEELVSTTVLTLRKMRQLVDELKKALLLYEKDPHDFSRLVDYESNNRVNTIKMLLFLSENRKNYSFDKDFSENIKLIYNIEDTIVTTVEDKNVYLKELLKLHDQGKLASAIEEGINFFEQIYSNEIA